MSDAVGGVGRSIGAVVAGIVVAVVGVFAVEALGQKVYPPPPGIDFTNPEAIKAMMKDIPLARCFLFCWPGWWAQPREPAWPRNLLHANLYCTPWSSVCCCWLSES